MNLQDRWHQTWSHIDGDPPDGLIDNILAAYSQPHRAYHNTRHLEECFTHLDTCPLEPNDPAVFELALWFHDMVYDPLRDDNEKQSAVMARALLPMLDETSTNRIERLILATRHVDNHDTAAFYDDTALLIDIDLAILGAPPERFAEYEVQIRREYAHVSDDDYRKGRAAMLKVFANRQRIYHTVVFHDKFDAISRSNVNRLFDTINA